MRSVVIGLLAVAAVQATPAAAAPSDDLRGVIAEHWRWSLAREPLFASILTAAPEASGRLPEVTIAAADRQAGEASAFIRRLDAIPDAGLAAGERVNKAILRRMLDEQVTANGYPMRLINLGSTGSWWQMFADAADQAPFRNKADYRSYLDRLRGYARFAPQSIDISRQAVRAGVVQPCETLGGVERSITGLEAANVDASRYFGPFTRTRPADVSAPEWAAVQAEARQLIKTVVEPQNRAALAFFRTEYLPKCRKTFGASSLPQGAAWYAWRVKVETTTDMTPDEVHQLGLAEVKRIRTEMEAVARKAGQNDRAAMIQRMRTDPAYYAKTPEELLSAASRIAKIIDGKMPTLFGKLPRMPYGVRPIPAETAEGNTTAYYFPGSLQGGTSGTYFVNTSKLDQRPLWELPALTAHEAVPGHHHQLALQQEIDLPDFRRYLAFFTAFTEGWGLYSEHLGIELGLYDTPEKDMGRLSYEMWRACRLVVDTGLHAKGWSKAQAVAFMKDNTALADANIDAEVNRYITTPGQALGYKIGEIRLRALRKRAETELGPKFNIRVFHDAVLAQGSVPLDVLDRQVEAYIASTKAAPTG